MTPRISEVWVYLAASPLLGLTLTLLAYQGATWVHKRCRGHPLANPVLLAVATLVALLSLTDTSYRTYFDGAQFVHFLLGPATVALAIPLYAQLGRLKRLALPLLVALLVGSLTAALSAVAIGSLFGAQPVWRQPGDTALAGPEVGDHTDCHGRRRAYRRPAVAYRGTGDHHGNRRRHRRALRLSHPAHRR